MHKLSIVLAALLLGAARAGDSQAPAPSITVMGVSSPATLAPHGKSSLEMVFVLDTTGSMGGMIEGAKQKIWSIVNAVLKSPNPPRVKVGLVAYRDHGDVYITKVLPLTGDMDAVYAALMSYKAEGGGDEPEDVRRALADGVDKPQWSPRAPHLAQALFLVGDAPPHDDYTDEPDTCHSADQAARAGIRVNAIQCGDSPATKTAWERIVRCGQGEFFQIAENGGVQETPPTPFDAALSDLGTVIGGTYIPYMAEGGADAARKQEKTEANLAHVSPKTALADRAVNKALNHDAYPNDLLQMLENKSLTPNTLAPERLPENLRRLSPEDRRAALERALADRRSVRVEILALSRQRDAYLGRANHTVNPDGDKGLDEAVLDALRRQAAGKGIVF